MDRLKLHELEAPVQIYTHLHSNMDRLKREKEGVEQMELKSFTFQYG